MVESKVKKSLEISEVKAYSEEVLETLQSLLPQLTRSRIVFSETEFKKLIQSENAVMLIARDPDASGKIVGTLCYVFFRIPTGLCFRIEDVVVDHAARGRGIGRKLMQVAIKMAGEMKADKIDLTSSPERKAANNLYRSIGFKLKKTNVYRYDP